MAGTPITIKSKDAQISGTTATLSSAALATGLIQNQKEALHVLAQIAPVKTSEISVDAKGRVVVANSKFAATLKSRIGAGNAADNHGCGLGCVAPDRAGQVARPGG